MTVDVGPRLGRRATGAYTVSDYALAASLLRDPRLRPGTTGVVHVLDALWQEHPAIRMLLDMVLLDVPPRHRAVRAVLHERFAPAAIGALVVRAEQISHELVDEVARRGGVVDVVPAIARTLPLTVIGEVLGLPTADRELVAVHSRSVMDIMWHTPTHVDVDVADRAAEELSGYFHDLVAAARRRDGGDDLTTALAVCAGLEDDEVVANLVFLVIAATFTTGDFLGSAVVRALTDPAVAEAFRTGDAGETVDEVLRLDPPVARVLRNTSEDMEIAGTLVPEGSLLELDLRRANRDPSRFEDPDAFRPGRRNARALSFSHGAHYCVGWALGRAEASAVLPMLLRRLPHAELAAPPVRARHPFLNGYASVPVRTGEPA
ncbi:cytochrome P450 [Cellulomonas sp. JZ18]|uniref:cytochrome P450 n=1 Tax=Cellulomonas sp. JZ18 TaxID=2654191 RepID=UPI0012D48942|nr:cytochrome P450 [Cellulomonas sp. JZ18]QGQ18361.1 cytochrome P450 [Cellulomonas sp. JZ18]